MDNAELGAAGRMQLVWFKRDLRVQDHAPLLRAALQGPVLCCYIYEDELLASEEFDSSHALFLEQSLRDLAASLEKLGGRLICRRGRLPEVFEELYQEQPWVTLWSHQETGNQLTYHRDLRVAKWCRERGVRWVELPQTGVIRRLKSRDGWASKWEERMRGALVAPRRLSGPALNGPVLSLAQLNLPDSTKGEAQPGGEREARACLDSFFGGRGLNYSRDLSSPLTGWTGCSRLSSYLAFGNVSLREVYQRSLRRQQEARMRQVAPGWGRSVMAFGSRLHWRCHFMQKLEDQPSLEFVNQCRSFDGLRENEFREDLFQAWCQGRTGYPMVDACMRALHASGWINFRMRAMLVSFASYHLWLHWRPTAVYLARHFLDFEAGIHFPQFQMQSGVTGINAIRIYNPIKQVSDHDPKGIFVRRYLPELAKVPDVYLAEPHKMPVGLQQHLGVIIGQHYPAPVVDHAVAFGRAKERIFSARDLASPEARQVYLKHGSRKPAATRSKPAACVSLGQGLLFDEDMPEL
jgi:deoxyribodipyrimidine photo-lyase